MIGRILFFLFALAAASARAADTPLTVSSDETSGSFSDTGEVVLKGNAIVRGELFVLTADLIRHDNRTGTLTAEGHVVFTRKEARLLADRLTYRRATGAFSAEHIRLGSFPFFAEGASAEGTPQEVTVRRARVSYGEPGPWQPTFTADTLVVAPGQQLSTENAIAGIGHVQAVPFPKFQHNFRQPFDLNVTLSGGYRRSLGAYVEGGVLMPVAPGVRVGADLGLYTNRGVMAGPAARYAHPENPEGLRGTFRSGFIDDHGDKKTDLLGRAVPEERAFAEWQHQQLLTENLSVRAQVNWWRDSEVLRDFRPRAFFPVQQPDSFVEAVYTGGNYFVSAFARAQPNRFHHVQERLPEIRFDLLPIPVGQGFYERFSASAAALREDPVGGVGRELRSDRLDAYYSLSRPIAVHDWLAVTPVVGGRITHYMNTEGSAIRSDTTTRTLGEFGVDASLRMSGTFDYKNPTWKIDGLRHLFTPRLSYRNIPSAQKGRTRIPQIDRESFSTYLQPLGLGDVRNIDALPATNTLRLSFDNFLQTRDPALGSRDLVMLNIAADFRFRRPPGVRDLSEIHTELALFPARWLQVDVYQSVSPRTLRLREFNSGITLRDGNVWSLRFSNNFLRDQLQDYSIDGRLRLNERFEAVTRLHYDARRRRFNEQSYGVAQNLGNTWMVSYMVSLYSGRSREGSFGFNVQVDTLRF